jgi:5-methylcytosine-specific restriction protein A
MPRKPLSHAQRMRAAAPTKPDDRESAAARGYGHRWRKLRLMHLRAHPMCQHPGCEKAASDVDHVVPRARGGDDRDANLQSLCHAHHSEKTAREDGGFGHGRA